MVDTRVILEEGASNFTNFVAVGGKLSLTASELVFRSNANASKKIECRINLNQVADVTLFKTLSINPNGLMILLRDGSIENFVVDNRKKWQLAILELIQVVG